MLKKLFYGLTLISLALGAFCIYSFMTQTPSSPQTPHTQTVQSNTIDNPNVLIANWLEQITSLPKRRHFMFFCEDMYIDGFIQRDTTHCLLLTPSGDPALIAIPRILTSPATPVVVYVRGQTEYVNGYLNKDGYLNKVDDRWIKKAKDWSKLFTSYGYILVIPGLGMTSKGPTMDIKTEVRLLDSMISAVLLRFAPATKKVSLLAYSLGTRTAALYASKYPERVNLIKFIAPTTQTATYLKCNETLPKHNIFISIYHGKKDVNVPYKVGLQQYEQCVNALPPKYKHLVKFFSFTNDDHWSLGYTRNPAILLPRIQYKRGLLRPNNESN